MNQNKNLLLYISILFFFVGTVGGYLFSDRQKKPFVVVDNGKSKIDSITIEQFKKDEKAKADSVTLSKRLDSIKKKYNEAKLSLNAERKHVLVLSNLVEQANMLNDTSAYFKYCNELSAEVKIQDIEIQNYQDQVDSLKLKTDSMSSLMASRVIQWRNTSTQLMQQAYKQAYTIDSISLKYNAVVGRKKKMYSVGIGACGGLTNFGIGGAVGIVVSKNVFTF
jgi:hypothetical protein